MEATFFADFVYNFKFDIYIGKKLNLKSPCIVSKIYRRKRISFFREDTETALVDLVAVFIGKGPQPFKNDSFNFLDFHE